jgi:hypothetical protein
MMPFQLIYSSAATERMPKSKLYKILLSSRSRNVSRDVTGLLVFVNGVFLQILEGERDVVSALMQTISSDSRHSNVKVLRETEVEQRTFASWRMAYVTPSAKELATWAGLGGAATLEATLDMLHSDPNRVSSLVTKLLEAIQEK